VNIFEFLCDELGAMVPIPLAWLSPSSPSHDYAVSICKILTFYPLRGFPLIHFPSPSDKVGQGIHIFTLNNANRRQATGSWWKLQLLRLHAKCLSLPPNRADTSDQSDGGFSGVWVSDEKANSFSHLNLFKMFERKGIGYALEGRYDLHGRR
jgi:hypothetical protein